MGILIYIDPKETADGTVLPLKEVFFSPGFAIGKFSLDLFRRDPRLSNLAIFTTLLMGQGYTVIHPSSGDASLFQHADAMEVCKFIDTVLVDSNWRIYSKYSLIRSKSKIDVLFSFVSACNLYMLVPHKDVCHNSGWHIAIWWNMCWHIGCYVCNSKQPIQQEMTYEYG